MTPSEAFERLTDLDGADAVLPNALAGEIGSWLLVAWEQFKDAYDPEQRELGQDAGKLLIAWAQTLKEKS